MNHLTEIFGVNNLFCSFNLISLLSHFKGSKWFVIDIIYVAMETLFHDFIVNDVRL